MTGLIQSFSAFSFSRNAGFVTDVHACHTATRSAQDTVMGKVPCDRPSRPVFEATAWIGQR
jgi:hypothetical protein